MEKSKKNDLVDHYYNENKFKEQSIENQRFDLLGLTSELQQIAADIYKRSKNLENKIDTIRDPKLLNGKIVSSLDYFDLIYNVSKLQNTFGSLSSFIDIYLTVKNDEQ